jgi:hypothetical protein
MPVVAPATQIIHCLDRSIRGIDRPRKAVLPGGGQYGIIAFQQGPPDRAKARLVRREARAPRLELRPMRKIVTILDAPGFNLDPLMFQPHLLGRCTDAAGREARAGCEQAKRPWRSPVDTLGT